MSKFLTLSIVLGISGLVAAAFHAYGLNNMANGVMCGACLGALFTLVRWHIEERRKGDAEDAHHVASVVKRGDE